MDGTVAWPVERAARTNGEAEAAVDGSTRLTWRQLRARLVSLGGGLARHEIAIGDRVGVLAHNSLIHLEAWLGLPAQGRVINDLNPRLSAAEQAFMVDDCETRALIVDDDHLDRARELQEQCEKLRLLIYAGASERAPEGTVHWNELIEGPGTTFPALEASTLAAINYTGGTSGRPKGVMLSHRNLLANAKHFIIACGHTRSDRYLHTAPMFHVADTSQIYAMTWAAGTHVILPGFRPEAVARTLQDERITLVLLVPTMVGMLLDHLETAEYDLSRLRLLMYAASPMPPETQRRALETLECDFTQMYGMTEAAPLVTQCTAEDHRRGFAGEEPYARRLPSAGAAVIGVECEVRDPDTGERVPDGTPGEIWVRGPNVMLGYWNREEETRRALSEDGWYRSGDMAYADEDGYLYIVDRLKDMIISGGENVYSIEVESVLYEHPDVAEAAVFGVPDERWGERVHAVIVPRTGTALTEEQVVTHAKARIAGYKVPRTLEIRTEPLPKSGAGKIVKRELREPFWAGQAQRVH
jgi:long-chain acyl-CoA synthetase